MRLILTPEQMKQVDEYAIKKLRIPSLQLMENAGKSIAREIITRIHLPKRSDKKYRADNGMNHVIIFCGKGNNGGDGFVTARLLLEQGMNVMIIMIEGDRDLSGDAGKNYQRLQDCKISRLQIIGSQKFQKLRNKKFDIIVDAILGTSFRGELKGKYLKAVQWCNRQSGLKVAIDIPTGLNGETGAVLSDAFKADITVTMSNPKIGFYRERAKEFTGEVVVVNIGIPKTVVGNLHKKNPKKIFLIDENDVRNTFPKRASNSHKHSVGKIFILAGSKSMMGAALLCSQSAMRSGAGQVILGIPDSEYPIIAKRTLEVMPLGLPATNEGSLSSKGIDEIEKRIAWANIVLLGCGLSRNDETSQLIREIVKKTSKPMIIDADGLNALIGHLGLLQKKRPNSIVLTPHLGEFSRLVGISPKEIEQNKFSIASSFAKEYNLILVLKGAPTITTVPSGKIFVNSTGNAGMSTAGSGDVLAGITASLIGQGNPASDAAINAVFLHGRSGDITSYKIGMVGMIASDIVKNLPTAITSIN